MSDEKLYEIPLEKQRESVLKLRSEIFPEVNDLRYWEVLFKWFQLLKEGHNEISFQDAAYYASENGIEPLEVIEKFHNKIAFFNKSYNPESVTLVLKYKFLVMLDLSPIRVARKCYENLRSILIYQVPDGSPAPHFTKNELLKLLNVISSGMAGTRHDKVINNLNEIGLVNVSGITTISAENEIVQYSLALNKLEKFDAWYKKYIADIKMLSNEVNVLEKVAKVIEERPLQINKYFQKIEIKVERPFCFVLMPFTREYPQVNYRKVIKPYIESAFGVKCWRADDEHSSKRIHDKIFALIEQSEFVVAEVASQNANVMYELGLAHALDKDVVIIAHKKIHKKKKDKLPFDIHSNRVQFYSSSVELKKVLQNGIASIYPKK